MWFISLCNVLILALDSCYQFNVSLAGPRVVSLRGCSFASLSIRIPYFPESCVMPNWVVDKRLCDVLVVLVADLLPQQVFRPLDLIHWLLLQIKSTRLLPRVISHRLDL